MCNIVLCIFHPAQQVDESSWSITSPEFFIFNSVFLIDSQIAKQKLEIHPLVALHTTIATTHPSTPDLPPASISLFNHTDTLPPRSFKPPTSFTSTPRRQTPPSLCRTARPPPPPLVPHPSASHFQAASGVTRGLHGSLSRSDSLVSAPSMQSVREMSSR